MGLEILVSLGTDTLVCVDLEDPHVGDRFYDANDDLVPFLSGIIFGIDIFIECLQMLEVCLRSCCCRSTFDICMVHLVLHGMWRWFFLHGVWRWLHLEDTRGSW